MGIVIGAFLGITWMISSNIIFIMIGYIFEGTIKTKITNYW